ncbi:MAG: DUF6591 domain-containing protein [Clostridia bacterium]
MRKWNRILGLAAAFALIAGIAAGCGAPEESTKKEIVTQAATTAAAPSATAQTTGGKTTSAASTVSVTTAAVTASATTAETSTVRSETADADEVTIEEQVLVERDGVKITAKSYVKDDFWGDGIKVQIENSTKRNVGISCNAVIVNNYMVTDFLSCTVAAGKKANETLYLSSEEMEAAGIVNVGQVEIYFHVYDSDSYDTLFDAEAAVIRTSAYDVMDITPVGGGTELYNRNGIRIVGQYVDEDSFWGTAMLMYLENRSGRNITVSCDNMSINGYMVTPFFYSEVYDGKMALDEITIFSSDLEENEIETVEEIEMIFEIYESDSFETIDRTDPIRFFTAAAEANTAPAETSSAAAATTAETTAAGDADGAEGMRPEFQEAMDAYEAFYDEYCEFMKSYQKNPSDLKLLAQYAEMLVRLQETEDAFEAWDDGSMTDEEAEYYAEVSLRIAEKLLEAAE